MTAERAVDSLLLLGLIIFGGSGTCDSLWQPETLTRDDIEWFKTVTTRQIISIVPMKSSGLSVLHLVTLIAGDAPTSSPLSPRSSALLVVFKAEQMNVQHFENFRAEVAAFHIDRILKFYKTPPVIGMKLSFHEFLSKLTLSSHQHCELCKNDTYLPRSGDIYLRYLRKKLIVRDRLGSVVNFFTANTSLQNHKELFIWGCGIKYVPHLVDASPWSDWKTALSKEIAELHTISALQRQRLQEYTQMHLFDFIIDNRDRYSGNNIVSEGDEGPLVFLDNGQAFWRTPHSVPRGELNVSAFLTERTFTQIIGTPKRKNEFLCKFPNQSVTTLLSFWAQHHNNLSAVLIRSIRTYEPLAEEVLSFFTLEHFYELDLRFERIIQHVKRCSLLP
jgi:hypothetical protein